MTEVIEKEKEGEIDCILNPQQKRMWDFYIKPSSTSFGNANLSAQKAGYTVYTANQITNMTWFKTKKRRLGMLGKAENALERALDMDIIDSEGNLKADLARVQTDVAKFVAKTLGKDEGYSERTEMTGANGQPIVFMPAELMDKYNLNKEEDNMRDTTIEEVPVDPQDDNICDGCE